MAAVYADSNSNNLDELTTSIEGERNMAKILPVCIQACPLGSSIFHSVKSGDFTYCLCSAPLWKNFNDGAGYTHPDIFEVLAYKNNNIPLKSVWFTTGSQDTKGQHSAWDVEALLAYEEWRDDDTQPWMANKVQVGFIQTVEKLDWEGLYTDGWGRKSMAKTARDALNVKVTPPWFAEPGVPAKGAPFPLDDVGNNHPMLADEPMAKFSAAHPDPDAWCKKLTQVTVSGKYHLWLVAWDTRKQLAVSSLVFLYYTSIDLDKKWVLKAGADPLDGDPAWTATGTQSRKTVVAGQGSVTPILTTPVANRDLSDFGTHVKGAKCPPKKSGS
jgi:hypothetical protein